MHGQALGVIDPRPSFTGHLWRLQRDKTSVDLLDEIVARTCIDRDGAGPYINLLAVAPELKGDWLAPAPASYAVAKRFGRRAPCVYAYAGSSFLGADLETTWQEVLRLQPRTLITNDLAVYPSPKTSINRSMSLHNHLSLLGRAQDGGLYKLETRLRADPGFVIFRRHK